MALNRDTHCNTHDAHPAARAKQEPKPHARGKVLCKFVNGLVINQSAQPIIDELNDGLAQHLLWHVAKVLVCSRCGPIAGLTLRKWKKKKKKTPPVPTPCRVPPSRR